MRLHYMGQLGACLDSLGAGVAPSLESQVTEI